MVNNKYFWKFLLSSLAAVLLSSLVFVLLTKFLGSLASLGLSFLFLTVTLWFTHLFLLKRICDPLEQAEAYVRSLNANNYNLRLAKVNQGELEKLAEQLNLLGESLEKRVGKLSKEGAQFHAMLASMIEGVIAVDKNDEILFCNEAARKLLGEVRLGKPVKKLWEFVKLLPLREMILNTREGAKSIKREISVRRLKDDLILEVQATLLTGAGPGEVLVVFHDITELRKLEAVRRDFVANVSHELKTPLTSIKGYVETLLAGAIFDKENNVRFLRKIDAKVDLLTDQVHDLLHLARIESREQSIPVKTIDMSQVMADVVQDYEHSVKLKGLQFEQEFCTEGVSVRADEKALRQVTGNLIENAIKYTPSPGKISLRVRRAEDCVEVEVEDSGIGIPTQEQERIFERFYRVDKARSGGGEASGTGLGLSIVKHLVGAMQGNIAVNSAPQKGSRFTVSFPISS